jgi:hypothetical protein
MKMQSITAQRSRAQRNVAQRSTSQGSTVQHSAVEHATKTQHSALLAYVVHISEVSLKEHEQRAASGRHPVDFVADRAHVKFACALGDARQLF